MANFYLKLIDKRNAYSIKFDVYLFLMTKHASLYSMQFSINIISCRANPRAWLGLVRLKKVLIRSQVLLMQYKIAGKSSVWMCL